MRRRVRVRSVLELKKRRRRVLNELLLRLLMLLLLLCLEVLSGEVEYRGSSGRSGARGCRRCGLRGPGGCVQRNAVSSRVKRVRLYRVVLVIGGFSFIVAIVFVTISFVAVVIIVLLIIVVVFVILNEMLLREEVIGGVSGLVAIPKAIEDVLQVGRVVFDVKQRRSVAAGPHLGANRPSDITRMQC